MKTSRSKCILAGILALALAAPAAAEEEGAVVGEILEVLKKRGLVTDAEYSRMVAKNAAYEKNHTSWMPKIDWSGDFRFRHESFWFDDDRADRGDFNRYRIRYRFRLKGKVEVNEHADVIFRLVSGNDDNRSTNQTLGSALDFDTDDIRLDLVYAKLTAPSDWVPLPNGKAVLEMGKVPNPFLWKESGTKVPGKDFMLWDNDITLEGASLRVNTNPSEQTRIFLRFGYYIDDENSTAKDPHFWGLQGGLHHDVSDDIHVGARATWYEFRSVNAAFNARGATGAGGITSGGGNIADGLNGDVTGDQFSVIHTGAYLTYAGVESWPITIYGEYARNLDSESSVFFPAAEDEDTAWGVGIEVGDKQKFVKLGAGYWYVEANAFPSFLIDSDLFDGRTNREGWAVYGSRELASNMDLNLTLFLSDAIEKNVPDFTASVGRSDRVRLQADMVFKF